MNLPVYDVSKWYQRRRGGRCCSVLERTKPGGIKEFYHPERWGECYAVGIGEFGCLCSGRGHREVELARGAWSQASQGWINMQKQQSL